MIDVGEDVGHPQEWDRRRNPPTLLVGMQAGEATLDNSMEVPQKVKTRATL